MAFSLIHRFAVQTSMLDSLRRECERTADYVWIGAKRCARPQRLLRHTLRGVAAKRIDLAIIEAWDGESPLAVEIGNKSGRYDGAIRTQIVLRHWYSTRAEQMPPAGRLLINREEDEQGKHIVVAAIWDGGSWLETHPVLKSDLATYDLSRLVLWHWTRYYQFVTREDAVQAADAFEILHPEVRAMTLAEANRLASRYLYDIARQLGWRKLTLREQEKHGLSGQWHREEECLPVSTTPSDGSRQGVGEYTLQAANGAHSTTTEPPVVE